MIKRLLILVLSLSLFTFGLSTQPVQSASIRLKYIFMYVGNSQPEYTIGNINKLVDAGVKGFVICPTGGRDYSAYNPYMKYGDFILKANTLTSTIVKASKKSEIYISTPITINNSNQYYASTPEIDGYIEDLKANIGAEKWRNNIKGLYIYDEYYYGDKGLKYMQKVGESAHKKNLSVIWAPPYISENYDLDSNGASDTNISRLIKAENDLRKTIADYILIQPGYYYNAVPSTEVFDYMKRWIKDQTINKIKSKYSTIGVVIEVDAGISIGTFVAKDAFHLNRDQSQSAEECTKRYTAYYDYFKNISGSYIYFCDNQSNTFDNYGNVIANIKKFYKGK